MEVLNHLACTIGSRPAGSVAEHAAASFIADRLRAMGLDVKVQPFHYVGWQPRGHPSVEVLSPKSGGLDAQPMLYSGSTPDEGIIGTLVPDGTAYLRPGVHEWRKYALLGADGEILGQLLVYPSGPPIPYPNPTPLFCLPTAIIGQPQQQAIDEWLTSGEVKVRLCSRGKYRPGTISYNVIATIPGQASDEVLVACAHYDSAYGSPGAADNASGVEALFRVANRLQASPPSRTIRLIFFAAEECSLLGSRYYVNRLKELGELQPIRGVVNLDILGGGEAPVVFFGPETLRPNLDLAFQAAGITGRWPVTFGSLPGPGSDHRPFCDEGIPCVFLEFWPYAAWHRPSDTIDHVSEDAVAKSAEAATWLLQYWSP